MLPPDGEEALPALLRTKQAIHDVIARVDEQAQMIDPDSIALLPQWEELADFKDPNEFIMMNIKQVQLMLQDMWGRFWARKAEQDKRLFELSEQGEEKWQEYLAELRRYQDEQARDRKLIQELMSLLARLAKEHRQCETEKAFRPHINVVQQLIIAIQVSVRAEVRDKRILKRIGDRMNELIYDILPNMKR